MKKKSIPEQQSMTDCTGMQMAGCLLRQFFFPTPLVQTVMMPAYTTCYQEQQEISSRISWQVKGDANRWYVQVFNEILIATQP